MEFLFKNGYSRVHGGVSCVFASFIHVYNTHVHFLVEGFRQRGRD